MIQRSAYRVRSSTGTCHSSPALHESEHREEQEDIQQQGLEVPGARNWGEVTWGGGIEFLICIAEAISP